jgi:hypothetical protein
VDQVDSIWPIKSKTIKHRRRWWEKHGVLTDSFMDRIEETGGEMKQMETEFAEGIFELTCLP